jgi:hypothetical protein
MVDKIVLEKLTLKEGKWDTMMSKSFWPTLQAVRIEVVLELDAEFCRTSDSAENIFTEVKYLLRQCLLPYGLICISK